MSSYTYKDSNRDWWKLTIKKGPPEADSGDPEVIDYWWDYRLLKEDAGRYRVALSGSMRGQYDHEPSVERVMGHIANRMTCLSIGFSVHARRL